MPIDALTTQIVSVHQSPMNAKRWCLGLKCGHELWVTASRRPKAKTAKCFEKHGAPVAALEGDGEKK